MIEDPGFDQAALYDLLFCLEEDEQGPGLRPLEEYLARFPALEEEVRQEYARRSATTPMEARATEAPRRIGPYRLLEELGRGGQGTVFLALDERLDRKVALKVLPLLVGSERRLERFRREAWVEARLDHPALCPVYDVQLEGDLPYIAMRYVEGRTLGHWIAESSLGTTEEAPICCRPRTDRQLEGLLAYFESVAHALHAAHEVGVIHRDVKPGNLMVTHAGEPVVLDFGIAHAQSDELETLTRSGEVFGTALYMSPEQLRGRRDVDRRADVYALGATLFEALTLRPPFQGDTQDDLSRAIFFDPVPNPLGLNSELPRSLRPVLETALDKDPQRRYPSALAMAQDLARVRQGVTVLGRRAGPWLRGGRWMRGRPVLSLALVALVVVAFLVDWLASERSGGQAARRVLESSLEQRLATEWEKRWRTLQQEKKSAASALRYAFYWSSESDDADSRSALLESLDALWERHRLPAVSQRFTCLEPIEGGLLACSDHRGRLRLWDPVQGERVDPWPDEPALRSPVEDLEFCPDTRELVASHADGSVWAWSIDEEREPRRIASSSGPPHRLSMRAGTTELLFSHGQGTWSVDLAADTTAPRSLEFEDARYDPSGNWIVAGISRPTLQLHDLRDGSTSQLETGACDRLAFDSGGTRLATASARTVRVFELSSATRLFELEFEQPPTSLDLDPRGTRLAVGHPADRFGRAGAVIDVATGRVLWSIPAEEGSSAVQVAFDPSGARLAVLRNDRSAQVYTSEAGTPQRRYSGLTQASVALAWEEEGRFLVGASGMGYLHVWYTEARPFLPQVPAGEWQIEPSEVRELRFDPGGSRLVGMASDGAVGLWTWPELDRLASMDIETQALAIDEQQLMLATREGQVRRFDLASGEERTPEEHSITTRFLEAGTSLVVLPVDASPFALETPQRSLGPADSNYRCAALDSKGERYLLASPDGLIQGSLASSSPAQVQALPGPWDWVTFFGPRERQLLARAGSRLAVLREDGEGTIALPQASTPIALAREQGWIVAASHGSELGIWDLETLERSAIPQGRVGRVTSVAIAGSAWVAAGSDDCRARVFDLSSRSLHLELPHHGSPITSLAIGPEGRYLVCGTRSGDLRVWPLDARAASRQANPWTTPLDESWRETRELMRRSIESQE